MIKSRQKNIFSYLIYTLIISLLLLNITDLFLFNFAKFISIVINSAVIISIGIIVHLFLLKKYNKDENVKNEQKIKENEQEQLKIYIDTNNKLIEYITTIEEHFLKLGIFNNSENALSDSLEENKDKNEKLLNRDEVLKKIKNNLGPDKINKLTNSILKVGSLYEIYYMMPFMKSLVSHSIRTTENAAINLIDRFEKVANESQTARLDAEKNFDVLKKGVGGKSFEEVIDQSNNALKKYDDLIEQLIDLNSNSGNKLKNLTEWIDRINNILKSIEEISAKNKIIAINSSIEAARLGEKGQGFRILANEIRKLNQKTEKLTKDINNIMGEFKQHNVTLIENWSNETDQIVAEIKSASDGSEEIIKMLINSYKITSDSFKKLNDSTTNIEKHLDNVMVSLQFQDITRQQLESVMDMCKSVQKEIRAQDGLFECIGMDLKENNKELVKKVKNETLNRAKHFNREIISKEFEEVENEIFNS